jgi:hypothetical protein
MAAFLALWINENRIKRFTMGVPNDPADCCPCYAENGE